MTVLYSSRLVYRGEEIAFSLKFDAGDWIIEGRGLDRKGIIYFTPSKRKKRAKKAKAGG